MADETAVLQRAADRDRDCAPALAGNPDLPTDAGGALAHERAIVVAAGARETDRMDDGITTQADPQGRRDDGGAVELLARAPLAFGRKIARGALDRDGGDAPSRAGGELRGIEHAGVAARTPGR